MPATKPPALILPPGQIPALQQFLRAVSDRLEALQGGRSISDRAVTVADMQDLKLLGVSSGGSLVLGPNAKPQTLVDLIEPANMEEYYKIEQVAPDHELLLYDWREKDFRRLDWGLLLDLIGEGGGGGNIVWATCAEADAGSPAEKAIDPVVGACSYDRKRVWGQHAAGKGTQVIDVPLVSGVATIDAHESNVFRITLTENVTVAAPLNPIDGQVINVILQQDGTGERTATWAAAWASFGGEPALTTTAGGTDLISCQYDESLSVWLTWFLAGESGGGGGGAPYTLSNIGAGAFIYKETVDVLGTDTARLRSLTGSNGITITQNTDEVDVSLARTIFVQASTPTANAVGDLWFW